MDAKSGRIYEVSEDEHKKLTEEHAKRIEQLGAVTRESARHSLVPLSSDEADFLKTKGTAFKQLWGKKMLRGLSADERAKWDAMINEFLSVARNTE